MPYPAGGRRVRGFLPTRRRRGVGRRAELEYMVRFSASDALYEQGFVPLEQPDSVELGPFPDYVEITYEYLRVGPDGEHVASFADGLWVIGYDSETHGHWTRLTPAEHGARFSDIVITARPSTRVRMWRSLVFDSPR